MMAEEAVQLFPFRIEANPHTLRQCGLSERDIDTVLMTLDRFQRLASARVANMAFLSLGSIGREAAISPYGAASSGS